MPAPVAWATAEGPPKLMIEAKNAPAKTSAPSTESATPVLLTVTLALGACKQGDKPEDALASVMVVSAAYNALRQHRWTSVCYDLPKITGQLYPEPVAVAA